jgi:PAS domain S-box-containing protein
MWGFPPEMVEQKDDRPVLHFVKDRVADPELFLQRVKYLYENKQETSHEEVVLKDDRIFERYTAPMVGPNKKYLGRIWYFHDISVLKQTRTALHENLELQSAAFRFSPMAIILMRVKDKVIVDINEFVTKKWGYTREELIGHTTEDLNIYVDLADRDTIIKKVNDKGQIDSFEFELCTKNKKIRTVLCTITIVTIKGEKHFLTLLQDITGRKKAEKALRASELKYKIVADNTYNWEYWTDKDNNFIYCSPSCYRITGYTAMEFIENSELKFNVVHPDFRSMFYNQVKRHYSEKEQYLQLKIIHKDGSERWVEHTSLPVFDSEGNYMGQRGSNADITEKKEIDRKILSTIISTEESERNKFAQELHDGLGPMISTMKLYFQWLSEPNEPEKKKKIIDIGMQVLDEAFMTVREISNNLSPRRLNSFGLVPTLKYLIQQLNETGKLSIEFIYDNEQRYNTQIEITLYRIISELLNNTIKYAMATRVVINLMHNYDKNRIQIIYTDDGKGFNFENVLENKKGMGLYNMMQRVETLQGIIKFDTHEGKPLNVIIELPIINENKHEPE